MGARLQDQDGELLRDGRCASTLILHGFRIGDLAYWPKCTCGSKSTLRVLSPSLVDMRVTNWSLPTYMFLVRATLHFLVSAYR